MLTQVSIHASFREHHIRRAEDTGVDGCLRSHDGGVNGCHTYAAARLSLSDGERNGCQRNKASAAGVSETNMRQPGRKAPRRERRPSTGAGDRYATGRAAGVGETKSMLRL